VPDMNEQSTPDSVGRRIWIPGAATAANIAAGFASMLMAAEGRFDAAAYLLVLAMLLDALDGRLARWLRATSVFGKHLDSFSDVLSFGAAPAFLIYLASMRTLQGWGLAAALIYLLAGVFRLARYNITASAHDKGRRTQGMPIPIAASYLVAAVLLRDSLLPLAAVIIVVGMGVLMTSRWPMPELRGRSLVTWMLLVGLANYMLFLARPSWGTFAWWTAWNALILIASLAEDRRTARLFPQP